jgi:hypothetical protein
MSLASSCPAEGPLNRAAVFASTGEIGILDGVSLRRRLFLDLLAGLLVAVVAMGVIYWQAGTQPADSSAGHTFRLLCPLH